MYHASSLRVDSISIDRSLMLVRKNRGPKIDHCRTPALTGNHSDIWPFKTWNMLSKKLLIRSNNALEIPNIDLSLKMSHSCQTLSKTLDISKKQQFKSWICIKGCINIMDIQSNWSTQKSLAQKPDWWADSSLSFSRYSNRELKISLSNIFPQIDI